MKKLIVALIAGLFATASFAADQATAPAAYPDPAASAPAPKAKKVKKVKKAKKPKKAAAPAAASAEASK